jgi:hypothetical protein
MYMKRHYCNISDEETYCIFRAMLMHTGGKQMKVHTFKTFAVRLFSPIGMYDK